MTESITSIQRLRSRLRSLGHNRVTSPAIPVQRPAEVHHSARLEWDALDELLAGQLQVMGSPPACLLVRSTFPIDHRDGRFSLSEALHVSPQTLSTLLGKGGETPECAAPLFIDVESTGLGTATGTQVFLLGIGRFAGDDFEILQYFLPGPQQERPFLEQVRETFNLQSLIVSYNGKSFDIPLLETRYLMQRQKANLRQLPHLDLLFPARRLYRHRVPDCCLGTIERLVLQVIREDEDIPGYLIPGIYFEYLRTGDPRPLAGVFYHNLVDILSLARLFAAIAAAMELKDGLHSLDYAGAARIFEASDQLDLAARAYRRSLAGIHPVQRASLLQRLAFVLKRSQKFEEAANIWQFLVESQGDESGVAHVELAKHLEHREKDYERAREVVLAALRLPSSQEAYVKGALEHRLGRIERKMGEI